MHHVSRASYHCRGRNVEGQCGVESLPLVTRPTPLLELHGAPLVSVHAGKLNSGAVLSSGEAWTWGEGKSGKLGHGNSDNVKSPARVSTRAQGHLTPPLVLHTNLRCRRSDQRSLRKPSPYAWFPLQVHKPGATSGRHSNVTAGICTRSGADRVPVGPSGGGIHGAG
jgi:hypothetical protein